MNDSDREFLAQQKLEEGNKLYYVKDYQEAIKSYDEVLTFGEYEEVYNNRGFAYYCLKKYQQALKDFDKAIELNPNHTPAKNNRELCLEALDK